MNTGRYSLKQLLNNSEIDQIIIPELQRDYVWTKVNVEGLLNSIFSNHGKKKILELEIKNGNEEISVEIRNFLSSEYARLRYNTQIGFIYAYHDADYAGKFFLIDGQQRLTTLYLLLLALYKLAKRTPEFSKLYFKDKLLKLDYKVREVSHDFMTDFVTYILESETDSEFNSSPQYYDELYRKDKTATSLLDNYKTIIVFLSDKNINDDIIDYVENFIEFNYFDTNLSEQGERLYLYMNSRGESLSQQEIVKASLIKRSQNKLEAGKRWEEWQNFFWKYRNENINADKGFEEFLKWSAIIHMCVADHPQLKEPSVDSNNRKQSLRENKEDYIRIEGSKNRKSQQQYWLKEYQKNNDGFDIELLSEFYQSLKKIEEYDLLKASFFRENWLADVKYTIDYVTICSAIYYLYRHKEAKKRDLERVCMYLKNTCYYSDNAKNPDRAVIAAIETIKQLCDTGNYDIINIGDIEKPAYLYIDSDKLTFECYKTPDREKWEEIFWKITDNNEICSFIEGDFTFFFNLSGDDRNTDSFTAYFDLFVSKIYDRKTTYELRQDLLKYGDISLDDGGGSYKLGEYMSRWNLIENDDDWRQALSKKIAVLKSYLDSEANTTVDDWRRFFIDNKSVMEYITQKKFLWRSENLPRERIVLLSGHQAGEFTSREIQIQLLHSRLGRSWVYKYDTCVIEFSLKDDQLVIGERDDQDYFMDIQYVWDNSGGKWFLYVGHRNPSFCMDKFKAVCNKAEKPTEIVDKKIKFTTSFYCEDISISFEQNIDKVKDKVDDFLSEFEAILKAMQ